MGEVLSFPAASRRVRIVEHECRDFLDSQLAGAAVALHLASGAIIDAGNLVREGRQPGPRHAINSGQALEAALQAVVHLINIRSKTTDRPVFQAAIAWFAASAGETPDAG